MKKDLFNSFLQSRNVKKLLLTMKLITVLLVVGLMQVSATVYSQATKFDIRVDNKQIVDVLKEIEESSNFRFFYIREQVDVERTVCMKVNNATVEQILDDIFADKGINYRVMEDKLVLLSPENLSSPLLQQQKIITGKVLDVLGDPIPGVNVFVKGTIEGTITDTDGKYSISSVPNDAVLVFSFIGMKTQEIVVGEQTNIDIIMEFDSYSLNEVITIGYGTQKKVSLTGSVSTLKSKDLTAVPVTNVNSMLVGRVPGLIMKQRSGAPGHDAGSLSIRGFGANNMGGAQSAANESPLVIVDGIERSFTQLDPNEIESVTILKDASAAVYGARAASGVILVTTKRGVLGKPVITYNGSQSFQQFTMYPHFVNALQYHDLYPNKQLSLPQDRIDAILSGEEPGTDWFDAITRNFAPMQNHNLNIRGGSENVKYFVSTSYLNQGSIWKSGDFGFERINVASNLDMKISSNLSASFDMGWRREIREDTHYNPLSYLNIANPAYPSSWPDPTKIVFLGENPHTPVAHIYKDAQGQEDKTIDVLTGGMKLDYKIPGIKGLSVDGKVGIVNNQFFNKNLQKAYKVWEYDGTDYIFRGNGIYGSDALTETQTRFLRVTTQLALRYSNTFGSHNVSGLLLWETVNEDYNLLQGRRTNLLSPSVPYLFTGAVDGQTATGWATEDGRESYVGRLNYGYKGKYLMTASFRYDASPRFPEDTRWGFFPGIELGWRISEEGFMKDIGFVHNLKLRASAARLGNDNTNGRYDYLTGYSINSNVENWYATGGNLITSISPLGEPNPQITWQESELYNVGITSSFLDGKLDFELDAFYRKRSNLLASSNVAIPNTVGANLPLRNINSRDNRGFEALVAYNGTIGEFRYNISGNVTWVREKYLHFEEREFEEGDDERINKRTGQWVNRTFGYVFDGFFNSQDEIDNSIVDQDGNGNVTLKPGDVRLLDLNGDSIINTYDRRVIGKGSTPELLFGIDINAQWKGFDFKMFWQGAGGFVQNMSGSERFPSESRVPYLYVYEKLWTPKNKEGAFFPARDGAKNNYLMDKYLGESSYIRLKNLVLGYTLPALVNNKIGAQGVRIYVSGTNLLTFDKLGEYPIDPESGGTYTYPQQRVYSVGVNVTF